MRRLSDAPAAQRPLAPTWRLAVASALMSLAGAGSAMAGAPARTPGPTPAAHTAALPADAASDIECSPRGAIPGGLDFSGQRLVSRNFAGRDLQQASFRGATLVGVSFVHARLRGADFRGATFESSSAPLPAPVDFTAADLDDTCFIGATFTGNTYFTAANLSAADFSGQDLTQAHAVFGDQGLRIDEPARRPRFQGATMSCEFFGDWNRIDLSNADLTACTAHFVTAGDATQGHDFSGAILDGVSFEGLDLRFTRWDRAQLRGTRFTGATLDGATGLAGRSATDTRDLSGAVFTRASLRDVDLSHALLYGANFGNAEMTRVNLTGAFLGKGNGYDTAARFDGAHLKYVNLSHADLTGASFEYASLYGDVSRSASSGWTCRTDVQACTPVTGPTCGCATVSGATLTGTRFANAFLYGVDFGGSTTIIRGTDFSGAVLVGASFSGATIAPEPDPGRPTDFTGAWLQGTDFTGTQLQGLSFDNAGVDFGVASGTGGTREGNFIYLRLTSAYTGFAGWPAAHPQPCLQLTFRTSTTIPSLDASNTCPDGGSYASGCGAPRPAPSPEPRWAARAAPALPRWFGFDSTYAPRSSPSAICDGEPVEKTW